MENWEEKDIANQKGKHDHQVSQDGVFANRNRIRKSRSSSAFSISTPIPYTLCCNHFHQ